MNLSTNVIIVFSFFLILFSTNLLPQAPDTLWTKFFSNGIGWNVEQTSEEGFILSSQIGSNYPHLRIIKTDANGNLEWSLIEDNALCAYDVTQALDGGYVVVGYDGTYAGDIHCYVLKVNQSGTKQWSWTSSTVYEGKAIQRTSDGGYIVAGRKGISPGHKWLLKLSGDGQFIWSKELTGTEAFDVQQTSDGGFILTGDGMSLLKTNASGVEQWVKIFGGGGDGHSVEQTFDGGFILAGWTTSLGAGLHDAYVIRTNANGDTLWTKTFGGAESDRVYSVQQTFDGGFILTGYTISFSTYGCDIWIIKTNEYGDLIWSKTIGFAFGGNVGNSIRQTSDGGYIIAGLRPSLGSGESDVCLIKLMPELSNLELGNTEQDNKFFLSQNYPNPFNPSTKISWQSPVASWQTLKIYDILGNEVIVLVDEYRSAGRNEVEFNASELTGGVYFYQLNSGDYLSTKKMILLK